MRRINLIVLAFVLFQTFSFAQKNKTKLLVGKWEWIESSGGFGGGILTPKTEAYTIRVEFTKKNIFKSYKDGVFNTQNNIKFVTGKSVYSQEEQLLIKYFKGTSADMSMMNDSFEFKGKDTLILKQECHDCYTRTFVRIKK